MKHKKTMFIWSAVVLVCVVLSAVVLLWQMDADWYAPSRDRPPKLDVARLEVVLSRAQEREYKDLDELARAVGLKESAAARILVRLQARGVPPGRWPDVLKVVVRDYHDAVSTLRSYKRANIHLLRHWVFRLERIDLWWPNLRESWLWRDATDAMEQGDIATALGLVQKREQAELREEMRGRRNLLADVRETLAEIMQADLRYTESAKYYLQAAEQERREESDIYIPRFQDVAFAHYKEGLLRREAGPFKEAVKIFHQTLAWMGPEPEEADWEFAQHFLGLSLLELAKNEPGCANLAEAAAVYRQILHSYQGTGLEQLWDWAWSHKRLGMALLGLAECQTGTEHLAEAATAFRVTLARNSREVEFGYRPDTQYRLGRALQLLGERAARQSALEEAVNAYQEALAGYQTPRDRFQRAKIMHDLGNTLYKLGRNGQAGESLSQAIAAYEHALRDIHRAWNPLLWAEINHCLGTALCDQADRRPGDGLYARAAAAYRLALSELEPSRLPLPWAESQGGLCRALISLGELGKNGPLLEEALQAGKAALTVFNRDDSPGQWNRVTLCRARAWRALGRVEAGKGRAEQALEAWQKALSAFRSAHADQEAEALKEDMDKAGQGPNKRRSREGG